jgi:hypothetical protein
MVLPAQNRPTAEASEPGSVKISGSGSRDGVETHNFKKKSSRGKRKKSLTFLEKRHRQSGGEVVCFRQYGLTRARFALVLHLRVKRQTPTIHLLMLENGIGMGQNAGCRFFFFLGTTVLPCGDGFAPSGEVERQRKGHATGTRLCRGIRIS